jgi:hypothetical protein
VGRIAPRLGREFGRRESDDDVAVARAVVAGRPERVMQERPVSVVDRRERPTEDHDAVAV